MLDDLAERPRTVSELASPHAMSLAGASKHIQVLERAGLIRREIRGRVHLCRINPAPLHAGMDWIRHYERFWNARLDALEAALQEHDGSGPGGREAAKGARRRT